MKAPLLQTLRTTVITLFFFLCVGLPIKAQNYYVLSMSGTVKTYLNGKWTDVKEKQKLMSTQRIKVSESSSLKLLQVVESKTVTISKPFLGTIKTFVNNNQTSVEQCTKQWLRYLVGKLLGKDNRGSSSVHMPKATTGYRGDSIEFVIDSILQDRVDNVPVTESDSCQ